VLCALFYSWYFHSDLQRSFSAAVILTRDGGGYLKH